MADVRIPIDAHSPEWRKFMAMCAERDIRARELVMILCNRERARWEQEQKEKEK